MERLLDQARQLVSRDSAVLVEFLAESDDPVVAMEAFHTLANEAYWERKDLTEAMSVARAGMTFGLSVAGRSEQAYELRSAAKAIAFNLASFAWPGWDEADITIEQHHLYAALDAARTNVRLAVELEKGSIAMGRGHWMVGATLLALGRYQEAIAEFLAARLSADEGRSAVESALAEGYAALVRVVERPGDEAIEEELTEILDRLRALNDGDSYAEQIETAKRVFGS
jgi:tetratricopeptide (TPR) repeat protein